MAENFEIEKPLSESVENEDSDVRNNRKHDYLAWDDLVGSREI